MHQRIKVNDHYNICLKNSLRHPFLTQLDIHSHSFTSTSSVKQKKISFCLIFRYKKYKMNSLIVFLFHYIRNMFQNDFQHNNIITQNLDLYTFEFGLFSLCHLSKQNQIQSLSCFGIIISGILFIRKTLLLFGYSFPHY